MFRLRKWNAYHTMMTTKLVVTVGDTIIVEAEEDKLEERKGTVENSNSDIPALKRTHRIYGSLPSEWM